MIQNFNEYDKRLYGSLQEYWCWIPTDWNQKPVYSDTVLIRHFRTVTDEEVAAGQQRAETHPLGHELFVEGLNHMYNLQTGEPTMNGRSCYHTNLKLLDSSREFAKDEKGHKDFIWFRLGEVYLSQAELYMYMGQKEEAAKVITELRKRALTEGHEEALKVTPDMITLDFILDEYMRELGPQAYADSMNSAKWGIDYLLDEALADLSSDEARAKAAFEGSKIVAQYAFDSIETEMYLKRISQQTGFSLEALYKNIGGRQSEAALNLAGAINARPSFSDNAARRQTADVQLQAERALLRLLTQYPSFIDSASQSGLEELLSVPEHKELFRLLKEKRERSEPIGIKEISLYYAADAAKSEIISAIYIDNTDFIQPAQYLNDALRRLKRNRLEHERQRLQEQLAQYTSSSLYMEDEEFKKLLKDIGDLDKKISALRTD